jgi:hypothetical protein
MAEARRRSVPLVLGASLAALGAGCGRRSPVTVPDAGSGPGAVAPASGVTCVRDDTFPDTLPVPEASAAAEVELLPGVRGLLVVSDSGRKGAAVLWEMPGGPPRSLDLPLDGAASDDLEGIAWVAGAGPAGQGALYTLTSSGAVRRFVPDGRGALRRDQDAYPLGPSPQACLNLHDVNCGRNYEGLCLRPRGTSARCAGYAASRKSSELECLVWDGDRLVADALWPPLALPSIPPGALSDCAFGAEAGPARATLLVTTNVHGGSTSYRVTEPSGALTPLDVAGTLSNEAIAVDRDGALYQLADLDREPSPASRWACTGW